MIPEKLNGKQLEELILFRGRREDRLEIARYGTQASFMRDPKDDTNIIQQSKASLPDFDLTYEHLGLGIHVIIEAKVCSAASFAVARKDHFSERQLKYMLKHAKVGALCFLMIHFNARVLKTKEEPAETFAIPVDGKLDLWRDIDQVERKSINREVASMYGFRVAWNLYSERAQKYTPDIADFISDSLLPF